LGGDGQAEVIEQDREFLVEFHADCRDGWCVEAAELVAGPVEGEVGGAIRAAQIMVCSGAYSMTAGSYRYMRSAIVWFPMR
jgi:hypothetical protein